MKQEFRRHYSAVRKSVCDKAEKDLIINNLIINSSIYKSADKVLCYKSLSDEINTDLIIADALNSGKTVALPRCDDSPTGISFYRISSMKDLKKGAFGISEPDPKICEKVFDFGGALCIVPGIAFDKSGGRLGYGKGYYDRLLTKNTLFSVGLCYNCCLCEALPVEKHDMRVSCIVTENGIVYL